MEHMSISQLKKIFAEQEITNDMLRTLMLDQRKGVQQLIRKYEREQEKNAKLEKQFSDMQQFDQTFRDRGYEYIAGVDEAGRGPLAGPVVAAAVILPQNFKLLGLTDSKQINEQLRNEFYNIIIKESISYHISIIDNEKVDQINIFEATKLAMKQSIHNLTKAPEFVLIDAVKIDQLKYPYAPIIKGDEKSISIAAASILAKVTRDNLMEEIHKQYPIYHFNSNMGYGTKHHLDMLEKHGITPYHRKTFSPVKNCINQTIGG